MKSNLILQSAVILFAFATVQLEVSAEPADASGTWKWSFEGRDGQTREFQLTLYQEENKLTGTLEGGRSETTIQEGKANGNELSFKTTRETQRGSFTANYQGKLEGDSINGSVSYQFGDRDFTRDWTAKREAVDPTGDWAWSMKRDDGQVWESTLKLKRDGDKVTGYFQREDSDWRLEVQNGKLNGSRLTFLTSFEREGQSISIKNTAVIFGDSIKGKSQGQNSEGVAWTREWEAKKK